MNVLEKILDICKGIFLIGTLSISGCHKNRPEKFVGFEDYFNKGYTIESFSIPTNGDIIYIGRTKDLKETNITDSTITLSGPVYYRIWPERKFTPKDEYHTDRYGNSPFNSKEDYQKYWEDIREGWILLKKRNTQGF